MKTPKPVKLIIGILAANQKCMEEAVKMLVCEFGKIDFASDVWNFDKTDYYKEQTGERILRQFVSIEKLIEPGGLAKIKHKTNQLEQKLASELKAGVPRPINFDPGVIEQSKLILATTKNYSHRIYIGEKIYAEVTLMFDKGRWKAFEHTYPDYRQQCYIGFFDKVRVRLLEQLKS